MASTAFWGQCWIKQMARLVGARDVNVILPMLEAIHLPCLDMSVWMATPILGVPSCSLPCCLHPLLPNLPHSPRLLSLAELVQRWVCPGPPHLEKSPSQQNKKQPKEMEAVLMGERQGCSQSGARQARLDSVIITCSASDARKSCSLRKVLGGLG